MSYVICVNGRSYELKGPEDIKQFIKDQGLPLEVVHEINNQIFAQLNKHKQVERLQRKTNTLKSMALVAEGTPEGLSFAFKGDNSNDPEMQYLFCTILALLAQANVTQHLRETLVNPDHAKAVTDALHGIALGMVDELRKGPKNNERSSS